MIEAKDIKKVLISNPTILTDRGKIRAFFCDVYNNDLSKVNVLLYAYDEGIFGTLRANASLSNSDKNRYIKALTLNHSIISERARWAVETWIDFYDKSVTSALDRIESEKSIHDKATDLQVQKNQIPSNLLDDSNDELRIAKDVDNYYINPKLKYFNEKIYVPCGFGNSDNGFFIYGINRTTQCTHPNANAYALVYNYLVRNSRMNTRDIPRFLQSEDRLFDLDYRSIFRLAIIILQLIRNNYLLNQILELDYLEDIETLNLAVQLIDTYEALFSRLMGKSPSKLFVRIGSKGIKISLTKTLGVYAENNDLFISNARELWYGRKIHYRLSPLNHQDLMIILSEISPFLSFKEGQLEALSEMVSSSNHSVCIMPTGSGKSLVFYLISILQPLPIFVVSPTDILIFDQIRNLRSYHRIDNVAHLKIHEDYSFPYFEMTNSINYITPTSLQNRNLLVAFKYMNRGSVIRHETKAQEVILSKGPLLSFVVLDEIHCLSNWSHDFRPEYLMLSQFLTKYLDQMTFLGFTATVNYTVIEDLQKQLDIKEENFFTPVKYSRNNVSYEFRRALNLAEMESILKDITTSILGRHERTIVFTKNETVSRRVADIIGDQADMFTSSNPSAYHHFVDGRCFVLVACDDLGVGINLPNVKNIIHFGLPLSKAEYVQEIGRAGRANEEITSYVVYLDASNAPSSLFLRDTLVDEIPKLIDGLNNDFSNAYLKLTNNNPNRDKLVSDLVALYSDLNATKKALYVETYQSNQLRMIKERLYMLYVVGFINTWYLFSKSSHEDEYVVIIDVFSSDVHSFIVDQNKMIARMKHRTRDYFDRLGNSRDSIAKVDRTSKPEEIIKIFVNWFYEKYLYHQHEQFLDLYSFISNSNGNNDLITSTIREFFTLKFLQIRRDETFFSSININDIGDLVISGISHATLANIERINSNRYSYVLDFFLFANSLKENEFLDVSRLERINKYMDIKETQIVDNLLSKIFMHCTIKGRYAIVRYVDSPIYSGTYSCTAFLDKVYSNKPKDKVYYGFVAKRINSIYKKREQSCHV